MASQVVLGPFTLLDADRQGFLEEFDELVGATMGKRSLLLFALHVGGLNLRHDARFIAALRQADLLVADGMSVAALLRLAGAGGLHRHTTTDYGWEVFETLQKRLGRPLRIALIGGEPGLAEQAGVVIAERAGADVVFTTHGFHVEWGEIFRQLTASEPDIVVVGLGMPTEAYWAVDHRDQLPPCVIMTCGGWFGYLVGAEKRAPLWMQRIGLEWLARLVQSPGRLWRRYAAGLWSTIAMVPIALRSRRHNRRSDSS